jgi:hypothetical protein
VPSDLQRLRRPLLLLENGQSLEVGRVLNEHDQNSCRVTCRPRQRVVLDGLQEGCRRQCDHAGGDSQLVRQRTLDPLRQGPRGLPRSSEDQVSAVQQRTATGEA